MVADRLVPAACSRRGDGYPGSASEGGTIAKGGGGNKVWPVCSSGDPGRMFPVAQRTAAVPTL